jgi:N-acetylneuraminic acid mutarotase
MFSRISKLFIVCIMLIVIGGVQQVAAVEIAADTWTQKADMPTARHYLGSAVVDGKIYVIGGAPVQCGITKAMEEYDPASDIWMPRADMPTARLGVRAAAVDGIIYAIGGWAGDTATCWGELLSTVEAYDPAADTWTTKTDMPTTRSHSAIAVVDGKIYVIGGQGDGNIILSAVEAYDPATDTWTTKADMPTARWTAACVVDGRIYVFCGNTTWDGPEGTVPTVEVYDPATDTWTQASDMPRARNRHTASVVDGKIYIIGGGDWPVAFRSPVVFVYDPATDTWTTAADFPTPRLDYTANVVDGKIYAIGGRLSFGGGTILSTVYEFDPGLPDAISSVSPVGKLFGTWGQVKKAQ